MYKRSYHNFNFIRIWPEKPPKNWPKNFFKGWSWFKFNNLWLALGTNLKFYTSLSKGLKLKGRKFLGLISTFVEVTGEKLLGGPSPPHQSWMGLTHSFSAFSWDTNLALKLRTISLSIKLKLINLFILRITVYSKLRSP